MSNWNYSGGSRWGSIPMAIRNLVIINALVWLATTFTGDSMYEEFALFPLGSTFFKWWQIVTHMFMHGGFWHIFFNMYTLLMFGMVLEQVWGSRKFLVFYFATGLGAALCHLLVLHFQVDYLMAHGQVAAAWDILRTPTVGASGAIYGVLLGFAMLNPTAELRLLIFPFFPLKAKWMVIIFGAIELLLGVSGAEGNVAHFAHLGGMVFGWLIIRYWRKRHKLYNSEL